MSASHMVLVGISLCPMMIGFLDYLSGKLGEVASTKGVIEGIAALMRERDPVFTANN